LLVSYLSELQYKCYGDQTLSAGEHFAAGFSQCQGALRLLREPFNKMIILGVFEYFFSLNHIVSIF